MGRFRKGSWAEFRSETRARLRLLVGSFYRSLVALRAEKIQFQANTLAYRTLINLVPMLAFVFSFFALFKEMSNVDLDVRLQKVITKFLPLESDATRFILDQVMNFVNTAKAGSYLGFLLLLLTSIFLFAAIEDSINLAFKVQKRRSFYQRLVLFTAILVWGPLLVGLSLYLTATIQVAPFLARLSSSPLAGEIPIHSVFQSLLFFAEYAGTYLLSFSLIFVCLFFLFKVFPHTYVENDAAAYGAFFSAFFFEICKWGFGFFATGMLQARAKIYASLAVFLVFLVWMYATWVIVLFGAKLAYVFQQYRYELKELPLKHKPVNRLWLAFQLMLELGTRFLKGENPASVRELAQRFCVGMPELSSLLASLEEAHLVSKVEAEHQRETERQYQPARELDRIFLGQLVSAINPDWNLEQGDLIAGKDQKTKAENQFILELFQKLKSEFDHYLSRRSLKEVLLAEIIEPGAATNSNSGSRPEPPIPN
jgi:membrane protein